MTLVGFRGQNHPQQLGKRGALDRVEESEGSVTWWGRPECDVWVYQGEAPNDVITVLQAAARGDDLKAVLDLHDGGHSGRRPK